MISENVKIQITSNVGGVQSASRELKTFNSLLGSTAKSIGSMPSSGSNAFGGFVKSGEEANSMLQRLTYSATRYAIIYKGLVGLGDLWDTAVGGAYRYSKSLETNQIGIAGILTSMTELNGQQMQWNNALGISKNIMQQLQSEALRTSATSEDLINTFRSLLGPGLKNGMKVDEIVKLSTVGVNAVRTIGLPENQFVQELRGLVGGGPIRPASSTLATALGITEKDIKTASASSEGLFKFLMNRLEGFDKSVNATSQSVAGRIARIEEGMKVSVSRGSEELYKAFSEQLGTIADSLILVKTDTNAAGQEFKKWVINPEIEETIKGITTQVKYVGSAVANVGKKLYSFGKDVTTSAPMKSFGNLVSSSGINAGTFVNVAALGVGAKAVRYFANAFSDSNKVLILGSNYAKREQQALQELTGAVSGYVATTNGMRSANEFLKSNSDSVMNLSKRWQEMGVSAQNANAMQKEVMRSLVNYGTEASLRMRQQNEEYAKNIQLQREAQSLRTQAGVGMLNSLGTVNSSMSSEKSAYNQIISGQRAEESVTRLAEKYRALGLSAAEAGARQKAVQDLIIQGKESEAKVLMGKYNEEVKQMSAIDGAYKQQLASIKALTVAKSKNSSQDLLIGFATSSKATVEKVASAQALVDKLTELGFKEEQIYALSKKYIAALSSGHKTAAVEIYKQLMLTDELIASKTKELGIRKEVANLDYTKMTAEQMKILELDAQVQLDLLNQSDLKEKLVVTTNNLNSAEAQGMISAEQKGKIKVDLLKQIAAGHSDVAIRMTDEIDKQYQLGTLATDTAKKKLSAISQEQINASRLASMTAQQITAKQQLQLEDLALAKANNTNNPKLVAQLQNIIAKQKELAQSAQKAGRDISGMQQAYITTLQTAVSSVEALNASELQNIETKQKSAAATLELNKSYTMLIGKYASGFISLGILAEMLGNVTGENDNWLNSIGGTVIQLGFAATAITSVIDLLGPLAKGLKDAAAAQTMLNATQLASRIGFVGGAALAVGGGAAYLASKFGPNPLKEGETIWSRYFGNNSVSTQNDVADFRKLNDNQEKVSTDGITPKFANDIADNLDSAAKSSNKINSALAKAAEEAAKAEALRAEKGNEIVKNAESVLGTSYGVVGCTDYVSKVLKSSGVAFGNTMSMAVDEAIAQAKAAGIWHYGIDGMAKGDVIAYASTENPTGSHVGIYGGNDDVYHNSRDKGYTAYHQTSGIGMGEGTSVLGYIRTSGGLMGDAQKQYENVEKLLSKLDSMTLEFTNDTKSAIGSMAYDEVIGKTTEKLAKASVELIKMKAAGLDTKGLEEAMTAYADSKKKIALEKQRSENAELFQMNIDYASRMTILNQSTSAEQDKQLSIDLANYKSFLDAQLSNSELTNQERAKYERELTSVIEQQNDIRGKTVMGGFDNILDYLRTKSSDFTSIIKQPYDDLENSLDGLMDGIITGQSSLTDNIISSWQNIANSVINAIWKVAVQAMIVKPLLESLGLGGSSKLGYSGGGSLLGGAYGLLTGSKGGDYAVNVTGSSANGGYAPAGWRLVGEEGPELVRFSNPAHVYTADQTKQALGGSPSRTTVVNMTVNTPNASSFKQSRAQISSQLYSMAQRGGGY